MYVPYVRFLISSPSAFWNPSGDLQRLLAMEDRQLSLYEVGSLEGRPSDSIPSDSKLTAARWNPHNLNIVYSLTGPDVVGWDFRSHE